MQPNSEPSPADVAMVQAALGGVPAPQPQAPVAPEPQAPAPVAQPQMQPEPTTPQPSPTSQQGDPFEQLFSPLPTEVAATPATPATPQPVAQPTVTETPVEPGQPVAPQPQAPGQQPAPDNAIPNQTPQGTEQVQTFDEYMASITAGIPAAPAQPDPSTINPDDPNAIKGFFDELMNTAVARVKSEQQRETAIQNAEKKAWDNAFDKYNSLRDNKNLRDMVHSIRMGHFQRGQAITPTQAADKLLDAMKGQYNKGVADNSVITTIESVQPQGGGTGAPVATSLDRQTVLESVQTGGETALAEFLAAEMAAGRMAS